MSARDRIKVVCRIRPENKIEKEGNYKRCVQFTDQSIAIECQPESKVSDMVGRHEFAFDRIFGPTCRQVEVFEEVAAPVVKGVLDGYNGTIFAYGQTGSGKSFSMEGVKNDPELKGIIPRMFDFLFKCISEADPDIEFQIKCSYLEIYLEKIQDLLDAKKQNLQVKEDKVKGLYVADSTEIFVNSTEEMMKIMDAGSQNRSVAATRMNAVSSRSHSIFLVQVFQKNSKTDASKMGKLFCCDLAGSEKVEKTEAKGSTLEEAKKINQSLSALGNVINALTEAKKNAFVPYRDSKLTRILQESLGGNSQTCLVITCSMSQYNDRETLSTLRFGNRAKSIKNAVKCNAQRSAKELLGLLNQADEKIKRNTQIITLIQARVKAALADGASMEDIKAKLQAIYGTKDLEILLSVLKGGEQVVEEEVKEEVATPAQAPSAANPNNEIQVAQIKQQLEQIQSLQEEKAALLEEKKQFEEELEMQKQEFYKANGKLIMEEFKNQVDAERQENLALDKLSSLKEATFRRQADVKHLRSKLEILREDLKIYMLSHKLKMQDLQSKLGASNEETQKSNDQSVDSEVMVNDQVKATLELILQIQQSLAEDLSGVLIQRDRNDSAVTDQVIDPVKLFKGRRNSTGNISFNQLGNLIRQNSDMPGESASPEASRLQLLKDYQPMLMSRKMLGDQTVATEMEYIKVLQQDGSFVNESSFFKSILNADKGDSRPDEVNELKQDAQKKEKEIEDLKAQVEDLENENSHLDKEYKALMKKQEQEQASTTVDTKSSSILTEDAQQVVAVKEQQIDQLSSLVAQKEQELQKAKMDAEAKVKEAEVKNQTESQSMKVVLQQQQQQIEKMNKIINRNSKMKENLNVEMVQEQNKLMKVQMATLHRQGEEKDAQIERLKAQLQQQEKRVAVMEKQVRENQLVNKMQEATGGNMHSVNKLIMPFSTSSGLIQLGGNDLGGLNTKVVKPIRGGGQAAPKNSNEIDFNTFMQKQQEQPKKQPITKKENKINSIQHMTGLNSSNRSGQLPQRRGPGEFSQVRGDSRSFGFNNFLSSIKSQDQMLKFRQKEDQNEQKAKKLIAQQKFKDARQLTAQQMLADDFEPNDLREGRGAARPHHTTHKKRGDSEEDGRDLNDTYAHYENDSSDEGDVDPSETREEYDSEDEESPKKKRIAQAMRTAKHDPFVTTPQGRSMASLRGPEDDKKKPKTLASKFMTKMSKGINKFQFK